MADERVQTILAADVNGSDRRMRAPEKLARSGGAGGAMFRALTALGVLAVLGAGPLQPVRYQGAAAVP